MHYMLVNLLHSHYIQHVMYVITYPLHAFEDANVETSLQTIQRQCESVPRCRRFTAPLLILSSPPPSCPPRPHSPFPGMFLRDQAA